MVISPHIPNLPYVEENGIKYFTLVAEPVKSEILPGIYMNAWGYNGMSPGPTICVYPDDYVCIRVYNKLPQPTSVHWHGLDVPNVMDGVPDIEPSPRIEPGQYFDYHFRITNPPGTHMYHSHFYTIMQDMMGLEGGLIILDPCESKKEVQRDYYLMLGAFALKNIEMGVLPSGVYDIDPFAHNSNFFTLNGRCFPYTAALPVSEGERVRIRFGNIGMMNHPMHLHGHQFWETAVDGNSIPKDNQLRKSTILVPSGTTRDLEFIADNPGRWPLHCHFPHHVSNNMTLPLGGMTTAVVYE
ncbi:multicopper oxidase family protein [Paenibacillus agilis]|uniref:Copper oxidase n=1 Tax=Paenibacillus agilis TaxID=3020863 RepID=A0A559IL13_9BACL|nr:multicopper oxidase domain-containing protein [Paenibacillus agilis]TVX88173.1 copper oxidase [Paenibacillus agilis]